MEWAIAGASAGGDEGDETVEGTDERGEAEHLLGGEGSQRKKFFLEVGADSVDAEGTGDQGDDEANAGRKRHHRG